eukprot:gene2618-2861_t
MTISFDNAIATLKNVFPKWDEDTLSTLLVANNYHVERTIETILSMSGDPNVSSDPPAASASSSAPALVSGYRGNQCKLPSDFLRPPGWRQAVIIVDEEIALMLQNHGYLTEANTNPTAYQHQKPLPLTGANEIPDMGIKRTLSSLSDATKRGWSYLSQNIPNKGQNNRTYTSNKITATPESNALSEFHPLLEESNREEGYEVVDLDGAGNHSNRSYHPLMDNSNWTKENESEELKFHENPMFYQQNSRLLHARAIHGDEKKRI